MRLLLKPPGRGLYNHTSPLRIPGLSGRAEGEGLIIGHTHNSCFLLDAAKEITANKADTFASSPRQLPFQTDVSDCKELLLKQFANASSDLLGKNQSLFHARRLPSSRLRRPRGAGISRELAKGQGSHGGEKPNLVLGDLENSVSWSFIRRKNSWGILQRSFQSLTGDETVVENMSSLGKNEDM